MIDNISVLNMETGEEIRMGTKTDDCYILDRIEWDEPKVKFESYKTSRQIGETITSVAVKTRKPSIIGYVVSEYFRSDGSTWAEYLDEQKRRIIEKKKELNRIFSIFQDVTIFADGYELRARPNEPVAYSIKEKENNEVLCYFKVELTCFDPLFHKNKKSFIFSRLHKKFHFPLVFAPPRKKVVFGLDERVRVKTIENDGDTDAGCTIIIKAIGGSVIDPKIYNTGTGEHVGFSNLTINDGDILKITTETRKENAVVYRKATGKEESVVGYTDEDSIYMKIRKGAYIYSIDVGEEFARNIAVEISFEEGYFNIENM